MRQRWLCGDTRAACVLGRAVPHVWGRAVPCPVPTTLHPRRAQGTVPTVVQMHGNSGTVPTVVQMHGNSVTIPTVLQAHRTPGTVPAAPVLPRARVAAILHQGAEMPSPARGPRGSPLPLT